MEVQPFTVKIPQTVLDDLRERLARTRWPDEIANSDWERGAKLSYMRELSEYWQTRFDWRAEEQALNALAHFRAEIDGFGIHFIHERGKGRHPLPLIITHGWPGSFLEMRKILPLLTDPAGCGADANDSFDVIVPSLPGYGFSDCATQAGMNAFAIADLWARLMSGLGYQRFGAQGGDWGASVTTCLAYAHPNHLAGIHLNYIPGSLRPFTGPGATELSEAERGFLADSEQWWQSEGGYAHIQRTKPQTLAYALNDSPVGLAGWIVEKFRDWSDCDGDVEQRFSKDELLTNVTLYWVTETIHASTRLYNETATRPLHFREDERIQVPCGVVRFQKEAPFPPREWVERCYDVQRWTEFPRGGHFAAMEEPELLVQDIRAFFRPLRPSGTD